MNSDGRHPVFDDRHTVHWYRSLEGGLEEARRAGKRVFLQYGALSCGGSRALIEKTIVKEEIAEFLNGNFVSVGIDAKQPDPEVAAILPTLPKQEPTPLCIYFASDGRVVHATAGGRPAAVFLRDMTEALAKK